jgi:hypothetical protein
MVEPTYCTTLALGARAASRARRVTACQCRNHAASSSIWLESQRGPVASKATTKARPSISHCRWVDALSGARFGHAPFRSHALPTPFLSKSVCFRFFT